MPVNWSGRPCEMNKIKKVIPKPSINRLIQNRLAEKDFINKLNIRTTRYVSVEKKSDIDALEAVSYTHLTLPTNREV